MRVHDGCGLDMTRPRMFYHESLQIRATTKIPPPPPPKSTRYTVYVHVPVVCQITWNHVNQKRSCSKSVLGGKIRPVTPVLFISTIR